MCEVSSPRVPGFDVLRDFPTDQQMLVSIVPTADENIRIRAAVTRKVLVRNYSDAYLIALYLAIAAIAFVLTRATWLISVPLVVMGVSGGVWLLQREARRRTRATIARDPHALEPYRVAVDESGIRTVCDHIECRMAWSYFTSVRETTELYLFLRAIGGYAIPKRVLDDATDTELRDLVRRWSPDQGSGLARVVLPVTAISPASP